MVAERQLGFEPRDVSDEKCGYDIESRIPGDGKLRFIEVKGRTVDADTVTVSRNEILTALNKPRRFHPGDRTDRRSEFTTSLFTQTVRAGAGVLGREHQL